MTEYSKIAEGQFTSTGVAEFINLPFLPNSFEIENITAWGTTTDNLVVKASARNGDAAGTAYTMQYNATAQLETEIVTVGGFSFIEAGTYQYGPTLTVTSVSQANPAVVTVTAHGLQTGDAVLIYGTTGMLQIAGEVYTITRTGANTFTIPVNSSGFAAAATAGFVKQVLYPDLYIPFRTAITNVTAANPGVITTAVNHAFVVGQEVYLQFPTVSTTSWGMFELDTETFNRDNVAPQQAYVTAVTANTITVNINTTGFTTFAYPTSAQAALGMTFPAVYAIGDANFGPTGPGPFTPPITIPGAFSANTRKGVVVGLGDGTNVMHATSDVVRWRAIYPDLIIP